jgi:gluconolactonase
VRSSSNCHALCLDSTGALYISLYNPNVIYCWHGGALAMLYDDWEQVILTPPTNIAFGGADMKTLLVASLCSTSLATARTDAAGLPLRYPTNPKLCAPRP